MTKAEFRIVVESPYGKQPTEQFEHFMSKVKSDAEARWGINISISRIEDDELPENGGFQE